MPTPTNFRAEPGDPNPAATQTATEHIYQNVEAVFSLYEKAERDTSQAQRGIERVVNALRQPRFLACYVAGVASWIGGNLLAIGLGWRPVDAPPFFWLQGSLTASSLLISIVILIAQNRQGRLAERRSHLDLQVNLLAERKITKLIALVEELRRDSPTVKDRYDDVAEAMKQPADPRMVVRALDDKINGP